MSGVSFLPKSILKNNTNIESNKINPTKNYKIDFEKGIVIGFCDEVEALKQAIYLILNTERYEYLIYSDDYGFELNGVIGNDKFLMESELKRRIRESLIQDDRIENVANFIFEYDKDSVDINFTVFSIYGEISLNKEVMI